jgi:hypothetical protein
LGSGTPFDFGVRHWAEADRKDDGDSGQKGITSADSQCDPNVPEKGHQVKRSVNDAPIHFMYNKDGYYIKAAACYIAERFRKDARRNGIPIDSESQSPP